MCFRVVRPSVRASVIHVVVLCFRDISSICWRISAKLLSLVHLGTEMNWLDFGIKRSKFNVTAWPNASQIFMFPRYLQYLLVDFHQTFVAGASRDRDDLITFLGQKVKVQGHTIAAEGHSTRCYRRVQLFLISLGLEAPGLGLELGHDLVSSFFANITGLNSRMLWYEEKNLWTSDVSCCIAPTLDVTHPDIVVGVGYLSTQYVCVCACVCVSTLTQKPLDVSSRDLASGEYLISPVHPFCLRSKVKMSRLAWVCTLLSASHLVVLLVQNHCFVF